MTAIQRIGPPTPIGVRGTDYDLSVPLNAMPSADWRRTFQARDEWKEPLLGPDPNAPKDIHLVGRYALGVEWQDRHSSIYPFEFLREACECPSCRGASGAGARTGESAWPSEIKREGTGLRIWWADGHETTFEGRGLRRLCHCAACAVHHE